MYIYVSDQFYTLIRLIFISISPCPLLFHHCNICLRALIILCAKCRIFLVVNYASQFSFFIFIFTLYLQPTVYSSHKRTALNGAEVAEVPSPLLRYSRTRMQVVALFNALFKTPIASFQVFCLFCFLFFLDHVDHAALVSHSLSAKTKTKCKYK